MTILFEGTLTSENPETKVIEVPEANLFEVKISSVLRTPRLWLIEQPPGSNSIYEHLIATGHQVADKLPFFEAGTKVSFRLHRTLNAEQATEISFGFFAHS